MRHGRLNISVHALMNDSDKGISMCTGVELQLQEFLTSALNGCDWSASRPGGSVPGKNHCAH
jgi:hypothetical protein